MLRTCIFIAFLTVSVLFGADEVSVSAPTIIQRGQNSQAIAVDESGNRYVVGSFVGSKDFNPYVGEDRKTALARDAYVTKFLASGAYAWTQTFGGSAGEDAFSVVVANGRVYVGGETTSTDSGFGGVVGTGATIANSSDAFVLALDANSGAPLSGFSSDGIQYIGGASRGIARHLLISGNTLYVNGDYEGLTLGIGAAGAGQSQGVGDGFVAALNATTGAALTAFDTDGLITYGGNTNDYARGLALQGGTLYVLGTYESTNFRFNLQGTTFSRLGSGLSDVFVAAVDGTTGAPKNSFSGDGIQTFVGTHTEKAYGIAATSDTVYIAGDFNSADAGIGGAGTIAVAMAGSAQDVFVLALNTSDGSPRTSFGGDGVRLFGSGGFEFVHGMTLLDGKIYVVGEISGNFAKIDGIGNGVERPTLAAVSAFVFAIDTATGAPVNAFSGDGIQVLGGTTADYAIAVAGSGTVLNILGYTDSSDFGVGGVGALQAGTFGAFLASLSAQTGNLIPLPDQLKVKNTNDGGPNSLRGSLFLAGEGSVITFDETVFSSSRSEFDTTIRPITALPNVDKTGIVIDASGVRATVNGALAGDVNGLILKSNGNSIKGLAITGFARSGIRVESSGNTLGGDRSVGGGANGNGLRISGCGSAGIEITGTAASQNNVQGCWIGVDASGENAQPNLTGIVVHNGAPGTTISDSVVCANSAEGIVVSDATTEQTKLFHNRIGTTPLNAARGNSIGVLVTQSAKFIGIGDGTPDKANTIANNGSSGIEVRGAATRGVSIQGNSITQNGGEGIALLDGANAGVTPPTQTALLTLAEGSESGTLQVQLSGTSGVGTIELFGDNGNEGATSQKVIPVASAGPFSTNVTVDGSKNLTATFTDEAGNTSPFVLIGKPKPVGDRDGDGISDALEGLAGTDPDDSGSAPVNGGVVSTTKAQIGLNFKKSASDSVNVALELDLPAEFKVDGAVVALQFGAYTSPRVTLGKSGAGKIQTSSAKISGVPKKSTGDAIPARITFASTKVTLVETFAANGLTDTNTPKEGASVSLTLKVLLESGAVHAFHDGTVNLLYKAKAGKTGKATVAK